MNWDRHAVWAAIISVLWVAAAFVLDDILALIAKSASPYPWVTLGILALDVVILAAALVRTPAATPGRLILFLAQLGLFYLFFVQTVPDLGLAAWGMGLAGWVVNGADFLDALQAFGLALGPAGVENLLVRGAAVVLCLIPAVLVLILLIPRLAPVLESLEDPPASVKWGMPAALVLMVLLMMAVGWVDSWPPSQWILWPLENLVKVIDLGDALQIFGFALVPQKLGWSAALLAVLFRITATAYVVILGYPFYLSRTGSGKASVSTLSDIFLDTEQPLEERLEALATVGRYGSFAESAVPHLVSALVAPEPEIRTAAAEALNEIDPDWAATEAAQAAVPDLTKGLRSNAKGVRLAAAEALGEIGPPAAEAAPMLEDLLGENDPELRLAACEALNRLGAVPAGSAQRLVKMLTEPDEALRVCALEALIDIGSEAVAALLATLGSEDDALRLAAIEALNQIDPQWTTSDEALEAIAGFIEKVEEGFGGDRLVAIQGLSALGPAARFAIPNLITLLLDGDRDVRNASVQALKAIDPKWPESSEAESAVPDLILALIDSDGSLQKTAGTVLAKVDPHWPRSEAAREMIPHFVKGLNHSLDTVRIAAAEALGRIGPAAKGAAPQLEAALVDRRKDVREAAAKALDAVDPEWRKGDRIPKSAAVHLESLESEDWKVRAAAVGALGELGPAAPGAVPHLVECLADPDRNVRATADEALRKIDPKWPRNKLAVKKIPHLMGTLGHGQWAVRAASVEALGKFGAPAAKIVAPRLVKMMNTDSVIDVRSVAKKTLARIDPAGKFHPK